MKQPLQFGPALALLCLTVLVLCGGYFSAYFALLESKKLRSWRNPLDLGPVYRVEHPVLENLLEPAFQVDRCIRAEYWSKLP